jgi:uncharacterized membrane protein YdbT with pleckstrin-like domain
MPDAVIRPTKKWIRMMYTASFIIVCVAVFAYNNFLPDTTKWPLVVAGLLFLWPVSKHLRQHFTTISLEGDKLRYETGILSKSIRTIQLSKVQDVRIDQTLLQRMTGTGNLSIETAGETSRLVIEDIDEPRIVADEIIDAAHARPPEKTPKRKGDRP